MYASAAATAWLQTQQQTTTQQQQPQVSGGQYCLARELHGKQLPVHCAHAAADTTCTWMQHAPAAAKWIS
jgi:hypothetical protein